MLLEAERLQVAGASRRLASERLVLGTAGNVSARREGQVAITPTGCVLAEVAPEQVSVVDLESGELVDGALEPTSELDLHLGVYRRYDAGAVVHTHAPWATAIACSRDELPCVHYQMLSLGGTVRVAPYRTFGTPELAAAVLDALECRTAALMANHGSVNFEGDMPTAVDGALLLEWACEVYWRAAALEGRTAALMANHGAVTWGADLAGALAATEVLEWACGVYWRACQVGTPRAMDADDQQAFVEAVTRRGYGRRQAT